MLEETSQTKTMKTIEINGVVGWDVDAEMLKANLKEIAPNDDVQITIDSPGGDFYCMVSMFNILRDFARNYKGTIETYIQGLAASCASMLALAAKAGKPESKIIVEDLSVYMIHNSWCIEIGDRRTHARASEDLQRIDALQRMIYSNATGKAEEELIELMNNDTFYYGNEIIEAGFADEMRKTENGESNLDAELAKTNAKATFAQMQQKMRADYETAKRNALTQNRVAALASLDALQPKPAENPVQTAATPNNNNKESKMTAAEIREQYPEAYAEIAKTGAAQEKERITAHLKMAQDSGDMSAALEFIESGVNCNENKVVAKYHEIFTKVALAKARVADNPPDVVTPSPASKEALIDNAFFAEIRG